MKHKQKGKERVSKRTNIPALIAIAVCAIAFVAIWTLVALTYWVPTPEQADANESLGQLSQVSAEAYEQTVAESVQTPSEQTQAVEAVKTPETVKSTPQTANASLAGFRSAGVINWGGYRWTWYGGRADYDKDCVLGADGAWRYNGMLVLASSTLAKWTVVDTPFGERGIVLD